MKKFILPVCLAIFPCHFAIAQNNVEVITIDKTELATLPHNIILRALIPALQQNNSEAVELLLPIYRQFPTEQKDSTLITWAEAILAKQERNYSHAIRLYRQLLVAQEGFAPVRLQLAIALFENNELTAAEDQFHKLQSEPMPEEISALIQAYLNAIARQDQWELSGGITYLHDPNVNNAPKSGTTYHNWQGAESESASGFGFNFQLSKKWSWGNGGFHEFRLNGNNKYYWNNKKYNEAGGRLSLGLGFRDAKTEIALLPFLEQQLYAGGRKESETLKRFSKTGGITLESSHWLSAKWRLNGLYEYGEQRYTQRKHLNGNYHHIMGGFTYLHNAKQYWFSNLSLTRMSARDKDDSYLRKSISIGWGQEWGKGLSTRLSFSYAHKNHKEIIALFNEKQRNKEYGVNFSIWHRAIHFWGITPRLTYNYNRVKSNISLYGYDKHRTYIDISRRF